VGNTCDDVVIVQPPPVVCAGNDTVVVGRGSSHVSGESCHSGPAQTHPGAMQLVGYTCDDAVMVHPLVGVCVGVADQTLHRLFQELGGDAPALILGGESSTLSIRV
jgi:hypothetical protein